MSWQEELRNLDEELASGRLSADDYRLRRDQVLSSAVAYGDPAQQQVQQPGQQPGQQPQQPFQQQPPPAAPQQQAPQQSGQQASADSTQIIAPVNQPPQSGEGERTQVVSNWQQQQADPNRTQVVPPMASPAGGFPQQGHASPAGGFPQQGQASPAGGFPQQQQQHQHGYQQQQPQQQGWTDTDASPPWGGSDFPPISPVGSTEWVKQGPELFEDKPKGKGGKIAIIAIVAVLVLAGLGVGGYFAFKGGGDEPADPTAQPQPTQSQNAPPTSSAKPKTPEELLFEKIPEQSGEEDSKSGAIPATQLTELAGLEKGEADLVIAAGVKQVAYRGSQKQPDETGPQPAKISVTVIPLTSPGAASDLVKQLRQYQTGNGFVQITEPLPGMPPKLNFQKKIGSDKGAYRGTWISGNNIVRVDILQNPLGGEDGEKALSGTYQRAVKKTLENYAVTS